MKKINLYDNRIGHEGAIAISDALKINSTLHEINLEKNQIGAEGASTIAGALKTNSTLKKIVSL